MKSRKILYIFTLISFYLPILSILAILTIVYKYLYRLVIYVLFLDCGRALCGKEFEMT